MSAEWRANIYRRWPGSRQPSHTGCQPRPRACQIQSPLTLISREFCRAPEFKGCEKYSVWSSYVDQLNQLGSGQCQRKQRVVRGRQVERDQKTLRFNRRNIYFRWKWVESPCVFSYSAIRLCSDLYLRKNSEISRVISSAQEVTALRWPFLTWFPHWQTRIFCHCIRKCHSGPIHANAHQSRI